LAACREYGDSRTGVVRPQKQHPERTVRRISQSVGYAKRAGLRLWAPHRARGVEPLVEAKEKLEPDQPGEEGPGTRAAVNGADEDGGGTGFIVEQHGAVRPGP
jgi:hypothetical protein